MTTSGAAGRTPAPPDDPQQLAEEIERTREQLGETVEALAARVDVKARAQEKAGQLTARRKARRAGKAGQQIGQHPIPLTVSAGAVGAAVLAVLLVTQWRRR